VGGVGDYVRRLSREFASRGHDVTVVTTEGLGEGAESRNGPSPRVLPVIKTWNLRGLRKLFKTLDEVDADVYVLEYVAYMYGRGGVAPWLLAFFLKFKLGGRKTLVLNAHELWRPAYRSARDKALTLLSFLVFLGGVGASRRVVVTNDFRKALLTGVLGVNPGRVTKIAVGANVEPPAPRKAAAEDNGEFRVMTFGRWHEDRAVEELVEAVAALRSTRRIGLSVIGSFKDNAGQCVRARPLQDRASREEWLEIKGDVSADGVSAYFAQADVYVSPLAGGPSGRRGSVIAALAHALPVVAYDGYERDGVFRDGYNAILLENGDGAGMRAALEALMDDRSRRLALGAAARATFEDYFGWDVIAGKWEELFAELARGRDAACPGPSPAGGTADLKSDSEGRPLLEIEVGQ
jgi:glycosyltransferase involved in cell wall biosynthesis